MGGEEGKNLQKLGRGQERNPQVSSLRVFCCSRTLARALQGSCMSMKSRGLGAAAGSSKGQGRAASGPAAGESVWLLPTVQLQASPWKVFKTTWSHVNKDSCLFPCLKSSWAQASSFFWRLWNFLHSRLSVLCLLTRFPRAAGWIFKSVWVWWQFSNPKLIYFITFRNLRASAKSP